MQTKPKLLFELASQLRRRVSPVEAAEELQLSPSQLIKIAKNLGVTGVMKGSRSRWIITHLDIRKIHIYLTALKLGYSENDSRDMAMTISEIVQTLYEFPASLEYEIDINKEDLKKTVTPQIFKQIIEKKNDAEEAGKLLDKFNVWVGIGGKVSLFATYLKEEIESDLIKFTLTPNVNQKHENIINKIKNLKDKIDHMQVKKNK